MTAKLILFLAHVLIFKISADIAAYLLEQSIPLTATDSAPLQDAIYWLEVSLRMEMSFIPSNGGPPRAPTSLLKNAGLAHAHLVQSKTVVEGEALGEFSLPSSAAAADVFSLVLLGGEPIYWPIDARCVMLKLFCHLKFI